MSTMACIECGAIFEKGLNWVTNSLSVTLYCPTCRIVRSNKQAAQAFANKQEESPNIARALAEHSLNRHIFSAQPTYVNDESNITTTDTYNHGYEYYDEYYNLDNYANLNLYYSEDGTLTWEIDHIYGTRVLQQHFEKGLAEFLKKKRLPLKHMKEHAYLAGLQNAMGELPNSFSLYTGDSEIFTEGFDSKLSRTVNQVTGEVSFYWERPFQRADLNKEFERGVKEATTKLNSLDQRTYRLEKEIPSLRKKQLYKKLKSVSLKTLLVVGIIALIGGGIYLADMYWGNIVSGFKTVLGWITFFIFAMIAATLFNRE